MVFLRESRNAGGPVAQFGQSARLISVRSIVQIYPGPPFSGGVAQLGERLPCTQEVIGSNPFTSTIPGLL